MFLNCSIATSTQVKDLSTSEKCSHTYTQQASAREAARGKHEPDSFDLVGSLKIQTCQKSTVGVLLQVKSERRREGGERESDMERSEST